MPPSRPGRMPGLARERAMSRQTKMPCWGAGLVRFGKQIPSPKGLSLRGQLRRPISIHVSTSTRWTPTGGHCCPCRVGARTPSADCAQDATGWRRRGNQEQTMAEPQNRRRRGLSRLSCGCWWRPRYAFFPSGRRRPVWAKIIARDDSTSATIRSRTSWRASRSSSIES